MRQLVVALAVVVTACSPGEGGSSSTSTTDQGTTTTTEAVTTTAPTTTSVPESTTSTSPASTTTTGLLPGSWADEPLITTDFGALGWWDGSLWRDAESEGALPVIGGEDYQVTRIGFLGSTTAGSQTTVCDPLELIGVDLDDPELLGTFPGPYGVAISAPWVLHPHLVETANDNGGTYSAFAAQILSNRGLDVPNPIIKQLIRTDLEGDGVNEVIVVAEDVTPGFILQVGDYSIAFMRKVVQGEVQTAILGDTVVLDDEDQFNGVFTVGTVADLSGDGKMEIVLDSAFFEGFSVSVWEYVDDDLGLAVVLETGCGS